VSRRKRIRTPVSETLHHVRAAGSTGASTVGTAKAIRMSDGRARCLLNALRDVGLVRATFDPARRCSVWLACPPVSNEEQALRDAAYAARERIRDRADARRPKGLGELTEYEAQQ